MLNQNFLNFLEFHLTKAFSYSPDSSVRSLWCDGTLLPNNENDYSKKTVIDKREIQVKAFIGKDGQGEYSLLMKFGRNSLSKYARDLDITDCIPKAHESDWYAVDTETNKMIIQLL